MNLTYRFANKRYVRRLYMQREIERLYGACVMQKSRAAFKVARDYLAKERV